MAHSDPSSSSPSTGVQPPRPPPPPQAPVQAPPFPHNQLLVAQIRLDRTNYSYWRVVILAAVRAHDLEGFLLGTIPPPTPTLRSTIAAEGEVPNPSFLHWQRYDQFLFHWLLNSITEPMLGHVVHCRYAAEVWSVLAQIGRAHV